MIGEETVPVTIETDREYGFTAINGDNKQSVSCQVVSDHHLHLTVNGQAYNVFVNDETDGKTIVLNGHEYKVQDADELERKPSKKSGAGARPTKVTPVTPSVVVSVLVKEGEAVEEDQKVVVLSAMKMEVTLTAPFAGTVTAVNAAEGDQVAPGDILVDIEKTE